MSPSPPHLLRPPPPAPHPPLHSLQVALRLYAVPEAISAAVCCFPDMKAAVETAQVVMASSIPVRGPGGEAHARVGGAGMEDVEMAPVVMASSIPVRWG